MMRIKAGLFQKIKLFSSIPKEIKPFFSLSSSKIFLKSTKSFFSYPKYEFASKLVFSAGKPQTNINYASIITIGIL